MPDEHRIVCISCFGADTGCSHARYIARRISKQSPGVKIVACNWSEPVDKKIVKLPEQGSTKVDATATSFREAVAACQRLVLEKVPVAA